jgi:PIN domain nuclease of toxin-antitoxin system
VGRESVIVLDTHVLVWWVSGVGRLSTGAKRTIEQCLREGPLSVSAITIFEIATAVRRRRLELASPLERWLADLQSLPELSFEPVTVEIARLAGGFEESVPGDPADRIIVATALTLGAKLVTADQRLRATPRLTVVW